VLKRELTSSSLARSWFLIVKREGKGKKEMRTQSEGDGGGVQLQHVQPQQVQPQ
jgi:hypothetical protein